MGRHGMKFVVLPLAYVLAISTIPAEGKKPEKPANSAAFDTDELPPFLPRDANEAMDEISSWVIPRPASKMPDGCPKWLYDGHTGVARQLESVNARITKEGGLHNHLAAFGAHFGAVLKVRGFNLFALIGNAIANLWALIFGGGRRIDAMRRCLAAEELRREVKDTVCILPYPRRGHGVARRFTVRPSRGFGVRLGAAVGASVGLGPVLDPLAGVIGRSVGLPGSSVLVRAGASAFVGVGRRAGISAAADARVALEFGGGSQAGYASDVFAYLLPQQLDRMGLQVIDTSEEAKPIMVAAPPHLPRNLKPAFEDLALWLWPRIITPLPRGCPVWLTNADMVRRNLGLLNSEIGAELSVQARAGLVLGGFGASFNAVAEVRGFNILGFVFELLAAAVKTVLSIFGLYRERVAEIRPALSPYEIRKLIPTHCMRAVPMSNCTVCVARPYVATLTPALSAHIGASLSLGVGAYDRFATPLGHYLGVSRPLISVKAAASAGVSVGRRAEEKNMKVRVEFTGEQAAYLSDVLDFLMPEQREKLGILKLEAA